MAAQHLNYPSRTLRYQERRATIRLTPTTIAIIGWRNDVVVDAMQRFSVAYGGPTGLWEALAYWSDKSRFVSMGAVVEAALWWNLGTAPQPAQKGSE